MARGGAGQFNVSRLFADYDQDLLAVGKKDDDRRPPAGGAGAATTWTGNFVRLRNRRRLFVIVGALVAAWLFIRGIPADFWEPNETGARRIAEFHSGTAHAGAGPLRVSGSGLGLWPGDSGQEKDADERGQPPRPMGTKPKENTQYYDGEILFHKLSTTLHNIQQTMGSRKVNHNVLFAASSLKSLGALVPMACEMTREENNFVHAAVFGRSEFDIQEILKINGVDEEECKVYWHDARPNWAPYSSDFRAEASVAGALEHIQEFMHPQAVIMDDSSLENQWFTRQVRAKAAKFEWTVIELPVGASERLHWISRLDTQSLRAFHKTNVNILVQAPKGEAGGLLRLLKNLKEADYHGLPPPRLTIELPPDVEPMLSWFISGYKWPPPVSPLQPALGSQLNVRHRIPGRMVTPEEASIRFLESFYPANAEHSHVLVLSPNVELSPLYYHWLMYYILHYKHSRADSHNSQHLVGMSLEVPTTYLDGTTDFQPPVPDPSNPSSVWPGLIDPRNPDTRPPFLWQAPNSNAALYFGDKWAEIHDFLKHRIRAIEDGKRESEKVVGEHLPAWTQYFLEIMRARGWSILYPPTSQTMNDIATVHKELWKPPEEFTAEFRKAKDAKSKQDEDETPPPSTPDDDEPLRAQPAHWQQTERTMTQSSQPLYAILPFEGEEPLLKTLPHLLFDGTTIEQSDLGTLADEYTKHFRTAVGGCAAEHVDRWKIVPGKAGDLFCWGDEMESEWKGKEEKPALGEATAKGGGGNGNLDESKKVGEHLHGHRT
jgi:hypothetical protein